MKTRLLKTSFRLPLAYARGSVHARLRAATVRERFLKGSRGFSLVEMLVCFAVLSVIMAAMVMFMGNLQQRYTSQQRVGGVNETGKTAMELLALDIGQAGFPGIVNSTATTAVNAATCTQVLPAPWPTCSPTLNAMQGIYVGRFVTIDTGTNAETVRVASCTTAAAVANGCTVTGANTMTGAFKKTHTAGQPVTSSMNPLPEGVPFDLTDTTCGFSSCASTLRIIGDLRGDGTLRYIEYRFTAGANTPTGCTGTLVRSDTDAYSLTQNAAVTIADNLCNTAAPGTAAAPGGIFSYTTPCQTGVALNAAQSIYITLLNTDMAPGNTNCRPVGTYTYFDAAGATVTRKLTYVANIGVTLQMRTTLTTGETGGTTTLVFKEQYFSPRNVVDALILDDDGLQTLLPVAPRAALGNLPAAP